MMDYKIIKINYNGAVNYVRITKHEEKWEYKDFILSASMYANISAYDIDYFTDIQSVRINEQDFMEIINKYENHPEFLLKIVLKSENNALHRNPTTVMSPQFNYKIYINAPDLETFIQNRNNAYVLNKKVIPGKLLKDLSNSEKRAIVLEGVDYLTSKYSYRPDPPYIIALALAIVELFPQLKSEEIENGGIDVLYDQTKNRGYIISRLKRVRQKLNISGRNPGKIHRKRKAVWTPVTMNTKWFNIDNDENILALKNFNVQTQKDKIKQKLVETLNTRLDVFRPPVKIEKFLNYFPFLFTSPDLILFDFEIRYPTKHQNFLNQWKICAQYIKKIFVETKGPNYKSLPEIEELEPSMQDFVYLLNILAQDVDGKSSANIQGDQFSINKIIVFRSPNLPLEELYTPEFKHPYIIAECEDKSAISNLFLCVERVLIQLPETCTFVDVIDFLFKSHYVFGQPFADSLVTFFNFLCYYFYEIKVAGIITPMILEVASKLDQFLFGSI